jgi:hypothetical protein
MSREHVDVAISHVGQTADRDFGVKIGRHQREQLCSEELGHDQKVAVIGVGGVNKKLHRLLKLLP